jgi:hypothetical protein
LTQESSDAIDLIWKTYHHEKKDAHGVAISGADHATLITRAKTWSENLLMNLMFS